MRTRTRQQFEMLAGSVSRELHGDTDDRRESCSILQPRSEIDRLLSWYSDRRQAELQPLDVGALWFFRNHSLLAAVPPASRSVEPAKTPAGSTAHLSGARP